MINSNRSLTCPLPPFQFLPGPLLWLMLMTIPLMSMSDIAPQTTESMFFLNLGSSLGQMWDDAQSISPPGRQLSQPASINFFHPLPFPSQIKNGKTFSLAVLTLNCQPLLVPRLKNRHVIYSAQQLMTSNFTSRIHR